MAGLRRRDGGRWGRWAARGLALAVLLAWLVAAGTAFSAPVAVKPGNAKASQFPDAGQCICHRMLLADWQQSMLSKALDDPLFKAKVAEADAASGGKFGKACRRCHAPVANMTGQDGRAQKSPAAAQSIVCSFCHQVVAVASPPANVSQLLVADKTMRAQIKTARAPHPTRYSALHRDSKICGGCHNIDHPITGMRLESTYDEWAASPQARKGLHCQDCHMSDTPPIVGPSAGFAAEGSPRRDTIYRMTFAGAQVALGNAERATALLRSAAEITLSVPEIVSAGGVAGGAGGAAEASVTVANVGAGHYLPTGATDLRQMWLAVTLVTDDGREVQLGRRVFGTEFKDKKGNHPVEITDVAGVAKDDRIPPMGSVTERYAVTLPEGAQAGSVRAQLLYKSVPDALAEKVGVANPMTVMAEASTRVFATRAAKDADAARPPALGPAGGPVPGAISSPTKPALICLGLFVLMLAAVALAAWRARKRGSQLPPA